MSDNERTALQELQDEARKTAPADKPRRERSPLFQSFKVIIVTCAVLFTMFVVYHREQDPCFDYRVKVTVDGVGPDRAKVWDLECTNEKGRCQCSTGAEPDGCMEFCAIEEPGLLIMCGLVCAPP